MARVQSLRRSALGMMFTAVLAACGGGGGDPIVARCVINSVNVSPSTATLVVGGSQTLGASANSQDCSSLPTTAWSSNANNIATVSASGSVVAVAPGTAVVTATIGSANGSAVITVTPPPIASIVVTPPSASVQIGGSVTLVAEPRDAQSNALTGRALAWQSLTPAVVSVSTSGVVTGVATGTGTVTVTGESVTQNVTVMVTPRPPASIVLTLSPTTLVPQQTVQATASVRDAQNGSLPTETVTWSSSSNTVASVNAAGLVTALTPGQTTIRATSTTNATVFAQAVVTVTVGAPTQIAVTLGQSQLPIAQTTTATAVVRDANQNIISAATITWSSSNLAVANVSASGVVTGVSAGNATITGTVVGAPSVTGGAAIVVFVPVATVTLSPNSVLLEPAPNTIANTQILTPSVRDGGGNVLNGRVVTYLSSNTAIASVNASGVVTAVAVGSATITATSEGISSAPVPVTIARAFAVIDANQSTTASYTPPFINSTGATVTIARSGVGMYAITVEGIGLANGLIGRSFAALVNAKSSNVNSALAAPSAICNGTNLSATGPAVISVRCEDPFTGAVKDAPFRAMLIGNNSVGSGGVASLSLHNTFSNTTYTPNPFFSWNSAEAAMSVTHGVGAPEFGGTQARHSQGVAFPSQYAFVSPYSTLPGLACEVQSQLIGTLLTDVVCFDRTGAVNAIHSVVRLSGGRPGRNGGAAFVGSDGVFSGQGFNSAGGVITSTRTAVGRYTVVFGGMSSTTTMGVMVSPWGATGWVSCSHFYTTTNPVTVDIACFNQAGAYIDAPSAFTVLVLQ